MKKYIIGIFVLIFIISGLFGYKEYNDLQNKYQELYQDREQLEVINDSLVSKNSLLLNRISSTKSTVVDSIIEETGSTIRNLTTFNIRLQDSIQQLTTTDSTIITETQDTMSYAQFEKSTDGFYIKGYFEKQDPWRIFFEELSYDLRLKIILTETKYGNWRTYVEADNDNVDIRNINTSVVPFDTPFKNKFAVTTGFGLGKSGEQYNFGATIGVAYLNHELNILFQTAHIKSIMLLYQKQFEIF